MSNNASDTTKLHERLDRIESGEQRNLTHGPIARGVYAIRKSLESHERGEGYTIEKIEESIKFVERIQHRRHMQGIAAEWGVPLDYIYRAHGIKHGETRTIEKSSDKDSVGTTDKGWVSLPATVVAHDCQGTGGAEFVTEGGTCSNCNYTAPPKEQTT